MHSFDFEQRRAVLKDRARDSGLDTVMIGDPVAIAYLTGAMITPYERFLALILDVASSRWFLVLPELERGVAVDSGVERLFFADDGDPLGLAADLMRAGGCLGLEKGHTSLGRMEGLMEAAARSAGGPPERVVDLENLVTGLRLVKSDAEATRLAAAAKAGDQVLERIKPLIVPGVTEKRLVAEMILAMSEIPGVSIEAPVILVLTGPNTANPHGCPGDSLIAPGDPVLIDFGVYRDGYWSDCTRTFFAGPPNPQLETIYRTVLKAQEAAIDAVVPGALLGDIDRAARTVIEDAGYGPWFTHRVGHGLGLSIHEAPSVHGQNHNPLEKGMVFTIEPGIYLPGTGGVRIEDDILVDAGGAKNLTGYAKSFEAMVLPV